jgi:hypothetical protein
LAQLCDVQSSYEPHGPPGHVLHTPWTHDIPSLQSASEEQGSPPLLHVPPTQSWLQQSKDDAQHA